MVPSVLQIVDLAFGDCGKGTLVDYYARLMPEPLVVRFNGGPQAGHNVVTPDGRHHTFSQFGSGSFIPGCRTFLSRFMLIEPYALFNEARHLESVGVPDPFGRLMIDARCPVITPAHQAANRLRELSRGDQAHGTCGVGVGETMADLLSRPDVVPLAGELSSPATIRQKLQAAIDWKREELRALLESVRTTGVSPVSEPSPKDLLPPTDLAAASNLAHGRDARGTGHSPTSMQATRLRQAAETLTDPTWIDAAVDNYAHLASRATIVHHPAADALLKEARSLIFEGAQGVLLDENFGFHPHTTWSTTTYWNADILLIDAGRDDARFRLGVVRTYFTRHGAGPFVTEDPSLLPLLPEPHNTADGWQGAFRVGLFDAVAVRYAIQAAGGINGLAVTHADRIDRLPRAICDAYARPLSQHDDALFTRVGEHIRQLRSTTTRDLRHQAQLALSLADCRPVRVEIDAKSPRSFAADLASAVNARLTLISSGPDAGGKRAVEATY